MRKKNIGANRLTRDLARQRAFKLQPTAPLSTRVTLAATTSPAGPRGATRFGEAEDISGRLESHMGLVLGLLWSGCWRVQQTPQHWTQPISHATTVEIKAMFEADCTVEALRVKCEARPPSSYVCFLLQESGSLRAGFGGNRKEKLEEVWVHLIGVPPPLRRADRLLLSTREVGRPIAVDVESLDHPNGPIKMSFGCQAHVQLQEHITLFVNMQGFRIRIVPISKDPAVETNNDPPSPPAKNGEDDKEEDQEETDEDRWDQRRKKHTDKAKNTPASAPAGGNEGFARKSVPQAATDGYTSPCSPSACRSKDFQSKKITLPATAFTHLEVGDKFFWCWLPANGHSGVMLMGVRDSSFEVGVVDMGQFYLSTSILNRANKRIVTIIGIYGPADHGRSRVFLEEISAKKTISLNQTAFIKGRNLLEGPLALIEIVHELRSKKLGGILVKIDFEKAYDRVNWEFLAEVLRCKGFEEAYIHRVLQLVSGGQTAISINGVIGPYFRNKRGVRQGDPLSPLLFNFIGEALSGILSAVGAAGHLQGVVPHLIPGGISHLQYADDTLILIQNSEENIANLKFLLMCFEDMSGLKINYHKSEVIVMGQPLEE
ncbi:hypothetical protein QYE76_040129 [Lolium multiflorum]|uniref:Reverse transcriptase domain-containing protein n=1 Tax=Lolium multiflorum TaxID=4521 RepID=A0AAD8TB59_LOLMU|nr:hypothetical protein QYE76_040129 [Lolium multiflorum]